ncbi:hypothetical protein EU537_12045 [Candidatus Thorarchaeota archaeon]|nr:MAG: hypothetical protein EU537_12045 [Candidatus Thorarchaeota archaeon]
MNAYFVIVLLGVILFFVVWILGWVLERLSHITLDTARAPGSRAWYMLVGPGVALHESAHALGCLFTGTEIVEFKPLHVKTVGDEVVLGFVKYRNPSSVLKRTVINLAPVALSLALLILFALGVTYLVPAATGIGGQALQLLEDLIYLKSNSAILNDPIYPIVEISGFVYSFFYTFAGLTVIHPLFWMVAFLAMTIMFSNAPSDVDVSNALPGLRLILVFDALWLIIAYIYPQAGWVLFGLFELLAVMYALAIALSILAYGFFIMITGMAKLKTPFNLIPFIVTIVSGFLLNISEIGTPALQTVISVGIFVLVLIPLLFVKEIRAVR